MPRESLKRRMAFSRGTKPACAQCSVPSWSTITSDPSGFFSFLNSFGQVLV